jgi:hypothetical protein
MSSNYARTRQCAECPWRRDVPTGRFPPRSFARLIQSCRQGWGRMFACHMSREGHEVACVGWLASEAANGPRLFPLRLALSRGDVDPDALVLDGPQFESFEAMCRANGVPSWMLTEVE